MATCDADERVGRLVGGVNVQEDNVWRAQDRRQLHGTALLGGFPLRREVAADADVRGEAAVQVGGGCGGALADKDGGGVAGRHRQGACAQWCARLLV